MFIKRLEESADLSIIESEFQSILEQSGWGPTNQIGLKSKENASDRWFDSAGSLYNRQTNTKIASESDFSVWNLDRTSYIRQQIEILESKYNFKSGRVRIMRLLPHCGLSVHRDDEVRYHLVIKTNHRSYIAHNVVDNNPDRSVLPTTAACYHIPRDSTWYEVDTREVHWVYNGGSEERIHLVVCGN